MRRLFSGQEGVYYNPDGDNILLLEKREVRTYMNIKNCKMHLVSIYDCSTSDYSKHRATVLYSKTLTKIGDL